MKKLPWFWIGMAAAGFFFFSSMKKLTSGPAGYIAATPGMTTLRIYWQQGYDQDFYGDGSTLREEALQTMGLPYTTLGIVDQVEHVEIDVDDLQANGIIGMLEIQDGVGAVELLGAAA